MNHLKILNHLTADFEFWFDCGWISEFPLKETPGQTRALLTQILYVAKDAVFGNIHCGKRFCNVRLEYPCVCCLSSKQNAPPRESGFIYTISLGSWRDQKAVCFPYPTTGEQTQLPQSLLIYHVFQTPFINLVAFHWTSVCPCLHYASELQNRHSTPDMVSQVLNRRNAPASSTCGQHMLKAVWTVFSASRWTAALCSPCP